MIGYGLEDVALVSNRERELSEGDRCKEGSQIQEVGGV
jgi:hypothetical protein